MSSPEAALRDESRGEFQVLRADLPFAGTLFLRAGFTRPRWVEFVESGTAEPLGVVASMSASVVLFVTASDRWFAYVFGHGHSLLRPGSYEPDFGLKVTLNAVDPDRLRSLDVHTIEELTLHTSRQISRESPLDAFGIDVVRDVLRAVTGEPKDASLAKRLVGADALAFISAVEFPELGHKCSQMLELYGRTEYQEHFAWVDNLRWVKDEEIVNQLNDELIIAIKGPQSEQPHLAPPVPVEWIRVDGFTYSTEDVLTDPHTDLELDDYLLSLEDEHNVTVESLKRDRVRIHWAGEALGIEQWTIFDCFVFERGLGDDLFVLTAGRWFRVARTFAERVREAATELPETALELPDALPNESEGAYNARVASAGLAVLSDRSLLRPSEGNARIEFCDLVTRDRQLVHVKKWSRSSTLSHLFAQGTVAGETLLRDAGFRDSVRAMLASTSAGYEDIVPEGRPRASDFEIAYAIIGKPGGAETLPFFSQLALSQAADRLRLLGYGVSTKFVPVSEN